MKTILMPVDFSPTSVNAANYACALAEKTGSNVRLLYAYAIPVPTGDGIFPVSTFEELEKLSHEKLSALKNKLQEKFKVNIEAVSRPGFAVEEIFEEANQLHPWLVVMGLKSEGKLSEIFFGSTTTGIISKASVPVLVIPDGVVFSIPEKLVFACDFSGEVTNRQLAPLKELAKAFSSEVLLANFVNADQKNRLSEEEEEKKIEYELGDINHDYYFPVCESFSEGLDAFLEIHGANMVVMTHHRHNLWYQLTHRSETRHTAFHTRIPLLNLSDNKS